MIQIVVLLHRKWHHQTHLLSESTTPWARPVRRHTSWCGWPRYQGTRNFPGSHSPRPRIDRLSCATSLPLWDWSWTKRSGVQAASPPCGVPREPSPRPAWLSKDHCTLNKTWQRRWRQEWRWRRTGEKEKNEIGLKEKRKEWNWKVYMVPDISEGGRR